MTLIVIGAPSHTGKDANAVIKAAFEAAEFPLTLVLTSKAHFNISLPEADLLLRPGMSAEARFVDFAALQRATSSLSQLAELNRLPEIASLAVPSAPAAASSEEEPAEVQGADTAEAPAAKPATTRKTK